MRTPSDTRTDLQPWGPEKKRQWFLGQQVKRSYREDVLVPLEALAKAQPSLVIEQYGKLSLDPEKFPLFAVRVCGSPAARRTVLVTGGVHGYETSGVKGALLFLQKHAANYVKHFNFIVAPCISPWAYETVNRLNPVMENPNREFKAQSQSEEARFLMSYLESLGVAIDGHIDLHETTDSDRQFIPEEFSKNGLHIDVADVDIPDGFYMLGVEGYPRPELERAMIESVRKVTHIAKPDANGKILDTLLSSEGVIHANVPGLCAEFTSAKAALGAFTTEVYPDGPGFKGFAQEKVEAICNEAQVACVRGALDFWIQSAG